MQLVRNIAFIYYIKILFFAFTFDIEINFLNVVLIIIEFFMS